MVQRAAGPAGRKGPLAYCREAGLLVVGRTSAGICPRHILVRPRPASVVAAGLRATLQSGSRDGHPAIGAGRASQPAKCLADIGFGVSALATLNQIPRMLERGRTVGTAFSPGFPLLRPQFVCQPALRPMRRADNTRRAAKPSTGFPGDLWVSKRAMNSSS